MRCQTESYVMNELVTSHTEWTSHTVMSHMRRDISYRMNMSYSHVSRDIAYRILNGMSRLIWDVSRDISYRYSHVSRDISYRLIWDMDRLIWDVTSRTEWISDILYSCMRCHWFICYETHSYVTRPIHMWYDSRICDMTHSFTIEGAWLDCIWVNTSRLVYSDTTCEHVTSHIRHDSFTCCITDSYVTWLVHTWHDSCTLQYAWLNSALSNTHKRKYTAHPTWRGAPGIFFFWHRHRWRIW